MSELICEPAVLPSSIDSPAPDPDNLWAVGYGTPAGAASAQTLTLNWNGTAWATVTSPNQGSPSVLTSVSTALGDAIVWAAGYSGTTGSFNPLILQNG